MKLLSRISYSGLTVRLVLLVLLAVVPLVAIILYTAEQRRQHDREEVLSDALHVARLAAANHERHIESARQLLSGLSHLHEVRTADAKTCTARFSELLKQSSLYDNIGEASSDGNVFCSAIALPQPAQVSDLSWFQRAVESRGFGVGEIQVSSGTGKPVLGIAYAVENGTGGVKSVLFAMLDLDWLIGLSSDIRVAKGGAVTLVDGSGTILTRHPEPLRWAAQTLPEAERVKAILTTQEGAAESPGLDGVMRVYAFTPLRGGSNGVYAAIGIPVETAYAAADRDLKRNLLVMFAMVTLSLLAARLFGARFILRPVNAIVSATKQLAAGDLTARTGMSRGHGELSLLARAVDDMAVQLEIRQIEAKLAEEALRLTQFTVDHAAEAALWVGLDGRLLYVNDATCVLLGYSKGELLFKNLQDIDAHSFQQPWTRLCQITKDNGSHTFESRLRNREGAVIPVEVTASYLEFNGRQYICAFARDITERERMEKALQQSAEEYRNLFESANDALLILDEQKQVILEANKRAFEVYGFGPGELIGMDFKSIAGESLTNGNPNSGPLTGSGHTNLEAIHFRKDGTPIDMLVSTSSIAYSGRKAVLSINRDVTEIKRLERQLMQSEKLSGLGRLISGIAHELNNPLTAVLGYTQLLLRAVPSDEQLRERLDIIKREAERTRDIVQDLLSFSSQRKPRPAAVDLNELLSRTLELRRHQTPADDVRIVREWGEIPMVLGDRHQLQQVFLNIIVNAEESLQETMHDGTVRITTYADHKDARDWVTVVISDDGPGIPPEHITKVFDPFFTTKPVGKGTGLGLSISYGIVKEHGGAIRVESRPGEGSSFIIDLPAENRDSLRLSA